MYRLEVTGNPPTLNSFYAGVVHWKRTKWKDEWREIYGAAIRAAKVPKLPGPITLEVTQYCRRVRDCDGAVIAAKFFADALVDCGIVQDDSPEYLSTLILRTVKGEEDKTVFLIL